VTVVLLLLSRVSYRDQEIAGPRLRGLLALLAGDLRAGCSTARLVERLWPDEQPENPTKALQVLVSRVRAQLGSDVIASTPIGYRLALSEDQVDASAVQLSASASARHSRSGDHVSALAYAEEGLALWDGDPSADIGPADPLSALRAARVSTHRALVRARALALSHLGRRAEAIEPLAELVQESPRDEEVLAELLRCEAATMGPSTALARYDAYRRTLRDQLGSEPGPALQTVHHQLLQIDQPVVRHGVAHEPNPLVGRDDDLAAVTNLLRTSRVTSIVGAGGLGKTRLAYAVGHRAEQRVVHFVPLAGVTTDGDVVNEVASVLGIGEIGRPGAGRLAIPQDALTGIVNALGPGPALLVLDNCEHVVHGAAELVHALVSLSKDVRVLTTSRAPLGLSSESVYLLPELSLPTAVELFHQRARAARPGVALPADVVRELCAHLDGLPLAVELAAARVRVMSVAEIARRLDDRFALLRGGVTDAPPRHHTLHAVIDWSWNLLESAAQAAMRALSVFPAGFTAEAARYLLDDGDVLPVLEQLVGQSLLKVSDTPSGTRFRMLETVREFSTARREEAGETGSVTDRFLAWARDFGVAHHASVFGADAVSSVERIRAEQDNLLQALRQGIDLRDGATVATASAALGGLWTVESSFARLATLAEEPAWVLSHYRPGPDLVEATRTASVLATVNAFIVRRPGVVRSLITLRRLPPAPPDTMSRAMEIVLRADLPTLQALCDSDDPLVAGVANGVASQVWENAGDLVGALDAAGRALEVFGNRGTPLLGAVAHSRIGELCLALERGDEARHHLIAALSVVEEVGARSTAARLRWAMVLADLQRGEIDEAEDSLEQAVRSGGDEAAGFPKIDRAIRAEILLARGDIEAGLHSWRQAAEGMRGSQSWALEVRTAAVIAHARHGRLDLVKETTAELPGLLSKVITDAMATSPESFTEFPLCGALLLALAMVDIDRGATTSGARMIALAQRLRFVRDFQPTMSAARAEDAAERADRVAYADALSAYALLDRDELRAAALAALTERDPV
jgi:predicted ATPase/DNA-binding SARP family transcriptional activator/predicted negative regulator of RcsB-dependent stress response